MNEDLKVANVGKDSVLCDVWTCPYCRYVNVSVCIIEDHEVVECEGCEEKSKANKY